MRCLVAPASRPASWLNLADRPFAEVSNHCVRRGSHCRAKALETSNQAFPKARAQKPFIWTKTADDTLASIQRFARRSLELHPPLLRELRR
jgi:hypothetical protein